MKGIKITINQDIEDIDIEDELEQLQEQVGGYIEIHSLNRYTGMPYCFVCNEEGAIKQLPYSVMTPYGPIHGPVLVFRENGPELESLTDKDKDIIVYYLNIWSFKALAKYMEK